MNGMYIVLMLSQIGASPLASVKPEHVLPSDDEIAATVRLSDDGRLLFAGQNYSIAAWHLPTRKQCLNVDCEFGHLIFPAQDGTRIITLGKPETDPRDDQLRVIHVFSKKPDGILAGHKGSLSCVQVSKDGNRIFSGGQDGKIHVFSVLEMREIKVIDAHKDSISNLAISSNSKLLATASIDETIKLWDTASWKELGTLQAQAFSGASTAFSPDARWLASWGAVCRCNHNLGCSDEQTIP